MPRLAVAREAQIDEIYRESHDLWGAGLGLADYRALWRDISRTAWGRKNSQFCVWLDDRDQVLSSMKLYRPRLKLGDRIARITVIGAVFTPAAKRRQGHAAEMVRATLDRANERGESVAMLFSDIGTSYYSALGFRALPAEEQCGTLPRSAPDVPDGWSIREMEDGDMEGILQAHDDFCMRRSIAIMRDAEHWQFLWVRSQSFFDRLGDPDLRQSCQVVLHDGRFAGYLITVEGRGEWNIRELGAVRGDPQAMATVLRVGASRARGLGLANLYAWLPREVSARLTDWRISNRPRQLAVPMILSLGDRAELPALATPEVAYIPFQDQF